MGDDSDQLQLQRNQAALLIRSKAHSNLISRGRKDASDITLRGSQEIAASTICLSGPASDPESLFILGVKYYKGTEVEKDYAIAAYWFEKAADLGHAGAEWYMSLLHHNGQGLAKDHRRSLEWCGKAAEHGNANAQFHLGWRFSIGRDVPQNFGNAVFWFRKSADQGHAEAQLNLATMYYNGQGLPQSYIESRFWSMLAERLGITGPRPPKNASASDQTGANLTPDQTFEIEKRVNLWIAEHGMGE
jgi:TPR repeat protein